jgi:hypothetical protein
VSAREPETNSAESSLSETPLDRRSVRNIPAVNDFRTTAGTHWTL